MTELLSDTMRERADNIDRPLVDFDAVMRAGDRRRKRRGALVVAGAAAVCAIVGFGAVQVAGTSDGAEAPQYANSGGFTERKVTYATGSTIHYGNQSIEVGTKVRAFVQTDDGFVFTDADGTVYLANEASVEEIGSGVTDGRYLRADDSGSYAAWVDSSGDGAPEFVVYDTATMTEVVRTSEGNRPGMGTLPDERDPTIVFAVDGDAVYVRSGEGLARIDLPSGTSEILRTDVDDGFDIPDVEDGLILRGVDPKPDGNEALEPGEIPLETVISRDPMANKPLTVSMARDLSPDGRYVATDYHDSERIFATRSAEEIVLDTAAQYDFQAVTRWLDADTVAVMALGKPFSDPDVSLLTCEIPSGACEVAADELPADLQTPGGEYIDRG